MSLRAELGALRSEARALRSLLERLEDRIRDLEASVGFELVEPDTPGRGGRPGSSQGTPPSSAGLQAASSSPGRPSIAGRAFADGSSEANPGPSTSEFRVSLAGELGRFLAGRLSGQALGASGRDRLHLSSKCYMICRDYAGFTHSPPLVVTSFARVRELCFSAASRQDCGESVFIGVPSQAEVRLVLSAANLPCPSLSGNGGRQ